MPCFWQLSYKYSWAPVQQSTMVPDFVSLPCSNNLNWKCNNKYTFHSKTFVWESILVHGPHMITHFHLIHICPQPPLANLPNQCQIISSDPEYNGFYKVLDYLHTSCVGVLPHNLCREHVPLFTWPVRKEMWRLWFNWWSMAMSTRMASNSWMHKMRYVLFVCHLVEQTWLLLV